jgi:hypothetical protein
MGWDLGPGLRWGALGRTSGRGRPCAGGALSGHILGPDEAQ